MPWRSIERKSSSVFVLLLGIIESHIPQSCQLSMLEITLVPQMMFVSLVSLVSLVVLVSLLSLVSVVWLVSLVSLVVLVSLLSLVSVVWLVLSQVPAVGPDREDPAPGLLPRQQASVSPPEERSRRSLRSTVGSVRKIWEKIMNEKKTDTPTIDLYVWSITSHSFFESILWCKAWNLLLGSRLKDLPVKKIEYVGTFRDDQHSHSVNMWRHGDPAHREQVGLCPEEGGLLHQPLSQP